MSVLTTIDGVPLYSTIKEALAWAKKNKLEGAHAHRSNNTLGYMGGSSHSTATQAIAPITFAQATTSTTTPPPPQAKKVWENIDGKCYCHGTLMGNAGCHGANCRTCCYNLGKSVAIGPTVATTIPSATTPSAPQDVADTGPGYHSSDPSGGGETTYQGGEGGY